MDTSKHKVLVVEDVKIAQKVAMIILKELGCDVETTDTGTQAIELANKRTYDIILMDFGLPDMDGLTVTETIRKMEGQNKRTVIIALSAHSTQEDGLYSKKNCMNVGLDDYIEKPLTKEIAIKMLEKFSHKQSTYKGPS